MSWFALVVFVVQRQTNLGVVFMDIHQKIDELLASEALSEAVRDAGLRDVVILPLPEICR